MNAAILLLIVLVPAPKDKGPVDPLSPTECVIGYWTVNWGESIRQGCYFLDNGTYCSPEFGSGPWHSDGVSTVTFREGQSWLVLVIETYNQNLMTGYVRYMTWDGHIGEVRTTLTMRRGERIRIDPREVK